MVLVQITGEFGNGQDYLEVYFTTPQLENLNVCN